MKKSTNCINKIVCCNFTKCCSSKRPRLELNMMVATLRIEHAETTLSCGWSKRFSRKIALYHFFLKMKTDPAFQLDVATIDLNHSQNTMRTIILLQDMRWRSNAGGYEFEPLSQRLAQSVWQCVDVTNDDVERERKIAHVGSDFQFLKENSNHVSLL